MKNNHVTLYVQSSCGSSRKAKRWLEEQQIPHEVVLINRDGISTEHLQQALVHTENGFEDVIKKTRLKEEMEDMSYNELFTLLHEDPTMIRVPLLFQGKDKILIGYNEEEICTFLPRKEKFEKMKQYHVAM